MKEMEYTGKIGHREVLVDEIVNGCRIVVLSLGTHPTAYVMVPDDHPMLEEFYQENMNSTPIIMPPTGPVGQISRVERMFGPRTSWHGSHSTRDSTQASDRPDGYKGFLLIRCPECGEIRGFCSKATITETTCRSCGAEIPLENLIPAHVNCGKCGSHFKYKTNIDTMDPVFYRCPECDAPVDLQMNGRDTALVTLGDRRGVLIMVRLSERRSPTGWSGERHADQ